MQATRKHLHLVAGRPMTADQQRERLVLTLRQKQERLDGWADLIAEVLRAMGWFFGCALAIAGLFLLIVLALSLGWKP